MSDELYYKLSDVGFLMCVDSISAVKWENLLEGEALKSQVDAMANMKQLHTIVGRMMHSALEADNSTMFRNIVWHDQIWIDLCQVLSNMPWLLLETQNLTPPMLECRTVLTTMVSIYCGTVAAFVDSVAQDQVWFTSAVGAAMKRKPMKWPATAIDWEEFVDTQRALDSALDISHSNLGQQVATVGMATPDEFDRKFFRGFLAFARLSGTRCKLNKLLFPPKASQKGNQSLGSLAKGKVI